MTLNLADTGVALMNRLETKDAPAAIGPYAQAIEHGGFLFTSGQIPLDPTSGAIVAGGIQPQTHQVMKNLKAILAHSGMNFESVIKATIYVQDMNDFATVNEIYGSYFSQSRFPARETVEVARLPKDVL